MTWTDIAPPESAGGSHRGAVMVAASRPEGRRRPVLLVTIRRRLFEGGAAPDWLRPGQRIGAQIGSGPNAGLLRLVPKGALKLGRAANGGDDVAILRLPYLPTQQPGRRRPVACEYDWDDTWLSIQLPAWCRAKPAVPQPALSPAAMAAAARPAGRAA